MLKFEEIGDVETDADGGMLPGVYSIPGVGFIVVGPKKETVIVRQWPHRIELNRAIGDIELWAGSKRLKLVEVREDAEG